MEDSLVSVIVPIYNTEKYLCKCVDSIIHQTYSNLQIILVNDGSTDHCKQICDGYEKADHRIIVIHKENGGASSAREAGISTASGKYLLFVDSDDWIDLETIQSCVETAERDGSDCVLFAYVKEYETKSVLNPLFEKDIHYNEAEAEEKIHRRLIGFRKEELQHPEKIDNFSTICVKLYRAEVARKGRIVSEREVGTSEDTIFNIYALDGCKSISYINRCFYHYRKTNSQAVTARYKPALYEKWMKLYQFFEDYFEKSGKKEDYRDVYLNRVACGVIGLGLNEVNAPYGIIKKAKNLQKILSDSFYREAFIHMDCSYCPLKWKFFFALCRWRCSLVLAILLTLMNTLHTLSSKYKS